MKLNLVKSQKVTADKVEESKDLQKRGLNTVEKITSEMRNALHEKSEIINQRSKGYIY